MKRSGIQHVNELVAELQKYIINNSEIEDILIVYDFAFQRHDGQMRKSGEPYIIHPLNVAFKLAEIHAAPSLIKAGLLHDVIEDTGTSYEEIQELFGQEVAFLVNGVTKISTIVNKDDMDEKTLENMFVTAAEDIRVMVVKIADRIHNMETLMYMSEEKKIQKSREVVELYAPIAWRLGLNEWKSALDDLAFKYLLPEEYEKIKVHVSSKKKERENLVNEQVLMLEGILEANTINFIEVKGRAKNFYSIYKKTVKKQVSYNDVHDLFAFRIVVSNVEDCYRALGLLHQQFAYLPNLFKDFISLPKRNGYQSIHTTIRTKKHQLLEIQIRTEDMDHIAEHGLAAHWKYKIDNYSDNTDEMNGMNRRYEWVAKLNKQEHDFTAAYIKNELLSKSLHVFTPKGQIIYLPVGSTIIDFAYHIHTDVAESMIGAKVNGAIVPITYKLNVDDTVEIITGDKTNKVVALSWYRYAKTTTARDKIKQYFRKQQKLEGVNKGRTILEYTFAREDIDFSAIVDDVIFQKALSHLHLRDISELSLLVIQEEIDPATVLKTYLDFSLSTNNNDSEKKYQKHYVQTNGWNGRNSGVEVPSDNDGQVYLANCCMPVSGDSIRALFVPEVGYVVHRSNCHHLHGDNHNVVKCVWQPMSQWDNMIFTYEAGVVISFKEQVGVISMLASVMRTNNVNINAIKDWTTDGKTTQFVMLFKVKNRGQVDFLMEQIKQQNVIEDIKRYYEDYEKGW